jgi:hypothetical protein
MPRKIHIQLGRTVVFSVVIAFILILHAQFHGVRRKGNQQLL